MRLKFGIYQIDQIIHQSASFFNEQPDWNLRSAASGSETKKLQEMASEVLSNDQYEFVGFQTSDENRKNYLRSKIYVSIPNTDGTSISLLEALAYGCIPIVSDLPANREWIEDGEEIDSDEILEQIDNSGFIEGINDDAYEHVLELFYVDVNGEDVDTELIKPPVKLLHEGFARLLSARGLA